MSHSSGGTKKAREDGGVDNNLQDVKNESISTSVKLLNMPYETLAAILMECKTLDFIRLISTCRTLRDLSIQEERILYRYHYHQEIAALNSHYISSHTIYSPVKSSKIISYRFKESLPYAAVNSWKVQLKMTVLWNKNGYGRKCMSCCSRAHPAELITSIKFKLRLCKICHAKDLVCIDDLGNYQLNKNDVKGAMKQDLEIELPSGARTSKPFYSRTHLLSLSQRKHGENFVFRPLHIEKLTSRREKQSLIEVATIIHGGCWYDFKCSGKTGIIYPSNDGRFDEEFQQYIDGISYKSSTGLKTRPLSSILTDYIQFVKSNQFHPSFSGNSFDTSPKFLPVTTSVPIIPSTNHITAYERVGRDLCSGQVMMQASSIEPRIALQNYITNPSSDNWILLAEQHRNISRTKFERLLTRFKGISEVYRFDFSQVRKPANQSLTEVEIERLQVSSQIISIIRDDTIPSYTIDHFIRHLTTGTTYRSFSDSWISDYFEGGNLRSTLKRVYRATDWDRRCVLNAVAQKALTEYRTWNDILTVQSLAVLTRSYYDTNQQRCHRRLILHPFSKSVVFDEIEQAVRCFESGSLTASSISATVFSNEPECACFGQKGVRCISDCWYTGIGKEATYCHGCGDYH